MECSACGTENRPESRFCAQCGSALQATCRTCGATTHPGDRFCAGCGAAIGSNAPEAAASANERRLVTVLFADLVGFTTLSEHRDPEEVRELLSRYFDRCRTLIERYGGTVEKFIGDAVMAVWGTPVAREDDAERAVRAALALTGAIAELGEEVGMAGLRVRAGVLTGNAAVEVGATGEGMVLGDTVNTASRLQSIAGPGTVLVDDVTRRATEAAIAYEDTGEHEVRGRDQPVHAWTALRVVAGVGGTRRSAGLEAPLAGRDAELAAIVRSFEATESERQAQLLLVQGDAGMGKSRLLWEFYKWVDGVERLIRWHQGRCLAYGEGVAYWALAEMVRARAGIVEEEGPATAREKLRATVEQFVSDERERRLVEPRLAHLLGLEQRTAADRADLFSGWRLFFERMAVEEPVVLVFEDLQWAESGLLDFIDYLLEWSAEFPIFILGLARPELAEARPAWTPSVSLGPLSDDAVDEMLEGLVPGLPPELTARVRERAEGVPLYAVETVRMLLDRSLLAQEGARYVVTGDVSSLDVPETLHALVAARLDELDPAERAVLQDASVLGQSFSVAALAAVSRRSVDEVQRLIDDLVAKQLLGFIDDPRSPERGQYSFLQALLRTIANGTLSRRDRKARHLAAARHLESVWGAESPEIAEVLASHYLAAVAAEPDAADAPAIRASARDTLVEAGGRAASLALGAEARRYFEQAAELTEDPVERASLFEQAGRAAGLAGDLDAARAALDTAAELFTDAGLAARSARASAAIAELLTDEYRLDEALPLLERAYAELAGDEPGEALAQVSARLARIHYLTGDGAAALEHAERALLVAEPLGLVDVTVEGLLARAVGCQVVGRLEEGQALMEHGARLAEEHGFTSQALRGLFNAAYLNSARGRFGAAREQLRIVQRMAHERGDRRWEQFAIAAKITLDVTLGDWDPALSTFAELVATGSESAYTDCLYAAVTAHGARGDEEDLTRAYALGAAVGREGLGFEVRESLDAVQTHALRMGGRFDEAIALTENVLGPWPSYVGDSKWWLMLELIDAALGAGRPEMLRAVADRLEELPFVHRTPMMLSCMHRARGHLHEPGFEAEFTAAEDAMRSIAAPFPLAQILVEHAEALVAAGRANEAGPLRDEARAIFERLRATPWLERATAAAAAA
jgi:class 3 adenylate cyclase/tetratricopeptide (TPR) repeat protein